MKSEWDSKPMLLDSKTRVTSEVYDSAIAVNDSQGSNHQNKQLQSGNTEVTFPSVARYGLICPP